MQCWAVLVFGETWLHRFKMVLFLQYVGRPWTSFVRCSTIYTDPFLMISGLLTSYSFYKQLERTKRLDIPREFVSRLMRYSTEFCVNCVSRMMRYSTEFCVNCVSRLMRYSTEFCVNCVSRLMRYSTEFCVKCVSRLMMYSTQFCFNQLAYYFLYNMAHIEILIF
jgi:hypothetical protein